MAVFRRPRSVASWGFFLGMETLAVESALDGISANSLLPEKVGDWQALAFVARSFFPGWWLLFSLTYSRGNYREFLIRWRSALAVAFLLPAAAIAAYQTGLFHLAIYEADVQLVRLGFGAAPRILSLLLLVAAVVILVHLEKTFRSAVGTLRWRIKFVVLGLAILLGTRIFVESQRLLYSDYSPALADVESVALLTACTLIAIAYLRGGLAELDLYPSQAVLHSSLTLLLSGGYLFVVGVLTQIVVHLGGVGSFRTDIFFIFLGTAGIALLLFSDRCRQRLQRFVSRHFARPQHDFRKTWRLMAESMSRVVDEATLCSAVARLVSETFNALSVSVWLIDEKCGQLILGSSTAASRTNTPLDDPACPHGDWLGRLMKRVRELKRPFDLESIEEDWGAALRKMNSPQFPNGGNRICIPFLAGECVLGLAVLADRVEGTPYTLEDLDLLECIGNQVAAGLLNLRLAEEIVLAKQLEAFQTMSAFFVHDLKNVVSGLSLTLQNLPAHFDDRLFRQDALRGISATVDRINHLIGRLSVLRDRIQLRTVEADLNELIVETLKNLNWVPGVNLIKDLRPVPSIVADPEHLQNVLTNLLLNARDVAGPGGEVRVATSERNGCAVLAVSDNGCGMSPEYLKNSLFRPFHTTKKDGLGIGLYQSRMIVEAHKGTIEVESEPGKGATFRVILPTAVEAL
jgi:putative PEP-CTERM system histidine kinase